MKLSTTCYSVLILVISVDCGVLKDFFGNVREDVHNVVDNTVNIIGKETHKITEGFGVFLHRKEGTKFQEYESVSSTPINQISSTEKIYNDSSKNYKPEGEAIHGQLHPTVEQTSMNDNKNVFSPQHVANKEYTTESNPNKNNNPEVTTNKHKQTSEPTTTGATTTKEPTTASTSPTSESISTTTTKTTESTTTSTNTTSESISTSTTTTTESVPWSNGLELENILPNIMHNEYDDTDSVNKKSPAVNTDSVRFSNTNQLGTGESNVLTNKTIELTQSNKTVKCNEDIKPTESQTKDHNFLSDQIFFKDDNVKNPITNNHNACPKGLVRAANGDCLERIEIDVREENEPKVSAIFEANGCPTNYSRAEDNSCQKIIGYSK